jgi:hypothetical protein
MSNILDLLRAETLLLSEWKPTVLDRYFRIKRMHNLDKQFVLTPDFQQAYAGYYGMLRFTTQEFRRAYFQLLYEEQNELEHILRELYKYPAPNNINRVEFSFATKLLNTLDATLPIYDVNVARVLNLEPPRGDTIDARIASCLTTYDNLNRSCADLISTPEAIHIVEQVRKLYPDFDELDIPDERVLDIILWKIGSRLKKHK